MPLGVNAISLAEKLRTPEDQILELQRHHVLPTSYTCSVCIFNRFSLSAQSNTYCDTCVEQICCEGAGNMKRKKTEIQHNANL